MRDDYRKGRPGPGRRPRPSFDDVEEDEQGPPADYGDEEEAPPPRRRGAPPPRRRPGAKPPARGRQSGLLGGLLGPKRASVRRPAGRERFDWAAADEEEDYRHGSYDDREEWDEEDERAPARRRPPSHGGRPKRRERTTLMDLCTPIFGYAAILPHDAGGMHPAYAQFRQEVLNALQRVESEAAEHGIDREDAADARYALALFMDEQVADSEWSGKAQWANEPLYMVLLGDPEGGKNFFLRLESLGDRQRAVKEVYLVCLAMGYRGQYAELDPTQQAARLGDIRQKTLRGIHPQPLDTMDVLFPEAYEPAAPIEDEAPPPPKLWVGLSIGGVVVALIVYVVLLFAASSQPRDADEKVRRVPAPSTSAVRPPAADLLASAGNGRAGR